MNPKKRTRQLPVVEHATLQKPPPGSLVAGSTRIIVVCGRVWWREPFAKVLLQLVPYEDV
jgi:hypothetical protein